MHCAIYTLLFVKILKRKYSRKTGKQNKKMYVTLQKTWDSSKSPILCKLIQEILTSTPILKL